MCVRLPGFLRRDDFRASFACLVSCEILTGRSSGERFPLAAFTGDTEPRDDAFDGKMLVADRSDVAEFDWLCDVIIDDTCSDVFVLFMD